MLFNSLDFAVFLPIVFVLYWFVTSHNLKLQNALIVAAGYVFYGWWDWRFLGLIVFSTFLDYNIGLRLAKEERDSHRKRLLWTSIFINLGVLGFFKYSNFFLDNFVAAFSLFGQDFNIERLNIILPVGISFYTFQTLSYTIDVYRKNLEPTSDFITFSAFVCFFPQLVAGPIERAGNLLPQLGKRRIFGDVSFREGIVQIGLGFFRKVFIADNIAQYVDVVFAVPEMHGSLTLVFGVVLYAFQIYFDFAGYSDIAIGVAKTFGFSFHQNFNLPYFSRSITEFWRRWHMSLSFWLRDYLYISIGGNRRGVVKQYRNLMITMLLGGLWHGSSWNFVIWGGIHGLVLALEKSFFRSSSQHSRHWVSKILSRAYSFSVVCIAWVFFRAPSFDSAISVFQGIFNRRHEAFFTGPKEQLFIIVFGVLVGLIVDAFLFSRRISIEQLGGRMSRLSIVLLLCVFIQLMLLGYSTSESFIYFQF